MFDIVKKELNFSIVSSIIYIVLGIIIIIYPEDALKSIGIAVAILAMIYGIIITVINITNLQNAGNPIFGILLIVTGAVLLMYPNSLGILLSLLVGIWFISNSVSRIKLAVMLKNVKGINWLLLLLISIITLLVGITFIFAPLASAITLAIIVGVLMIVYSVCDIVEIIFIKKNIKTIQKALK